MRGLAFLTRFFALWTCLLVPTSLLQAQSGAKVDVTGTWKADFNTQIGLQKYTFTLKQDGAAVSGKAAIVTSPAPARSAPRATSRAAPM